MLSSSTTLPRTYFRPRASGRFSIGSDSPVSDDWLTKRSLVSMTRTSAGIMSPAASVTMSPGTSSSIGSSSTSRPARFTEQVFFTIFLSASLDRLARQSWQKRMMTLSRIIVAMIRIVVHSFSSGAAVGSTVLAEVKSQPVSSLIDKMLLSSDNVLAEMLARVVSKAMGFDGSSTSLAQAIPGALVAYGLDTTKVTVRDGSGLSDLNAVSPQFVTALLTKVNAGEKDLGVLYSSLPVAGVSGSLASRFNGPNAIAAGSVMAKTGWLDSEYSLAGMSESLRVATCSVMFSFLRDLVRRLCLS